MDDVDFIRDFLAYYAATYGSFQKYDSGWYYNTSEAISQLVLERDIKKHRYNVKNNISDFNHLRAIDLANFSFCPASFAIANSFDIEHKTGEKERKIGELLHEKLKLIKRVKNYKSTGKIEHKMFDDPVILKILKSENVYIGHLEESDTFFNSDLNIASKPDYIFKDSSGNHFVVEEKFQYKRDPRKETFDDRSYKWNNMYSESHEEERKKEIKEWDNHKPYFYLNHRIQVITYLKSIQHYNLKYGYLIYWYYDYRGDKSPIIHEEPYINPYIHKVSTKKITLNDRSHKLFRKVYSKINEFLSRETMKFRPEKLKPKKCGGCVVNKYCGHKSKNYHEVSFPYKKDYLSLFQADYDKI